MGRIGMIIGAILGIGLVAGGMVLTFAPLHRTPPEGAVGALVATERPASTAVLIPTAPPCATAARAFIDTAKPMAERWDDAAKLAGSTPRMSLAPQIASMQAIRRDAQALEAPPCAEQAKQYLLGAMDASINAYIDFLAQKPDSQTEFYNANRVMKRFYNEVALLTGAPIEKDILEEQLAENHALYASLGYDLQIKIDFNGILTWQGESNGTSLVITPNGDGTIKSVDIYGEDSDHIAKTAQVAAPAWTDAKQWIDQHQEHVDLTSHVNGASISFSRGRTLIILKLSLDSPQKLS